jgi:t-SNARE complex subunit (syntaxin)
MHMRACKRQPFVHIPRLHRFHRVDGVTDEYHALRFQIITHHTFQKTACVCYPITYKVVIFVIIFVAVIAVIVVVVHGNSW